MANSYYDILNCKNDATYEEIKLSYQNLVRQYHPDKNVNTIIEVFHNIDEAWKTLKNEVLRKEYDLQLLNEKLNTQIHKYASLNHEELDYDIEEKVYSYNCRCGGVYAINEEDIKETCLISCDECSFFIEVLNK